MKKILEVGCGNKKLFPDSIGLDCARLSGVDIVHNLDIFPYPFENNEFDEIYAYMVLEHVTDFFKTMEEIYRILKVGGKFFIRVPYFRSTGAYSDPTHKTFFTEESFEYFYKDHPLSYYTSAKFMLESKELFTSDNIFGKIRSIIPGSKVWSNVCFNWYTEIRLVLIKK